MTDLMILMASPEAWLALATLVVMEVVLGIDNLVFVSILSNRLPEASRGRTRRIGIGLALVLRLGLLSTLAFIVSLTRPVITLPFTVPDGGDGHPVIVVLGFCLASGGVYSGLSTFWTVPSLFLGGTAAAGAFALINCVGNLSGFVGPGMMGYLLQATGSYRVGMLMCTAVPLVAAISSLPAFQMILRPGGKSNSCCPH